MTARHDEFFTTAAFKIEDLFGTSRIPLAAIEKELRDAFGAELERLSALEEECEVLRSHLLSACDDWETSIDQADIITWEPSEQIENYRKLANEPPP